LQVRKTGDAASIVAPAAEEREPTESFWGWQATAVAASTDFAFQANPFYLYWVAYGRLVDPLAPWVLVAGVAAACEGLPAWAASLALPTLAYTVAWLHGVASVRFSIHVGATQVCPTSPHCCAQLGTHTLASAASLHQSGLTAAVRVGTSNPQRVRVAPYSRALCPAIRVRCYRRRLSSPAYLLKLQVLASAVFAVEAASFLCFKLVMAPVVADWWWLTALLTVLFVVSPTLHVLTITTDPG
jgi:hypothetical protein